MNFSDFKKVLNDNPVSLAKEIVDALNDIQDRYHTSASVIADEFGRVRHASSKRTMSKINGSDLKRLKEAVSKMKTDYIKSQVQDEPTRDFIEGFNDHHTSSQRKIRPMTLWKLHTAANNLYPKLDSPSEVREAFHRYKEHNKKLRPIDTLMKIAMGNGRIKGSHYLLTLSSTLIDRKHRITSISEIDKLSRQQLHILMQVLKSIDSTNNLYFDHYDKSRQDHLLKLMGEYYVKSMGKKS